MVGGVLNNVILFQDYRCQSNVLFFQSSSQQVELPFNIHVRLKVESVILQRGII